MNKKIITLGITLFSLLVFAVGLLLHKPSQDKPSNTTESIYGPNPASQEVKNANSAYAEGDFETAVMEAKLALEKSPEDVDLALQVAQILKEDNKAEEAKTYYLKALNIWENRFITEKKPTPSELVVAGELAVDAGDIEKAKQYFNRTLNSIDDSGDKSQFIEEIIKRAKKGLAGLE